MYVAVKGGEKAIEESLRLLDANRRGDPGIPELTVDQIVGQLSLGVARVMTEGSLYDPELAAIAIKQAQGDLIEAIYLLRAYRTTLPRLGTSEPLDTARMTLRRRISATFKDVPGGQVLGPTYDYTHRLLDFTLADEARPQPSPDMERSSAGPGAVTAFAGAVPRVVDLLDREGLIEGEYPSEVGEPTDITRAPLTFPADRAARLQSLARGD